MNRAELESALAELVRAQPEPTPGARRRIGALVRRRSRLRGVTAAVAAVVVIGIVAVEGHRASRPDQLSAVELIVERHPDAATAEVLETVRLEFDRRGQRSERILQGRQLIDFEHGSAGAILLPKDRKPGAAAETEQRVIAGITYSRYSVGDRALLGIPTPWVGIEAGPGAPRYLGAQLPSLSPAGVLDHVGQAQAGVFSSVRVVGREQVGGLTTTHYRLTADPVHARAQLVRDGLDPELASLSQARVTAELWVDDDRLIRRSTVVNEDYVPFGDVRVRVTVTQDVVAYGVAVPTLSPPRPGEITWMSAAELGSRFGRVDPATLVHDQ